jgi:hypothetical protein
MLLHCGGYFSQKKIRCRTSIQVSLPAAPEPLLAAMREAGWYVSIVSAEGAGHVVFDVLCNSCARTIYGDEVLAVARKMLTMTPGGSA